VKIYIVSDMEGISAVYQWNQVRQGHPYYERYRRILTDEVNAAVEGALAAGAETVVVNDGHGSEDYNLDWERLHPAVYVERADSSTNILPSLDESFRAVLLVGYHAMEGTEDAVLAHTQNHEAWQSYRVNGILLGEIGQMALIAGGKSVPVSYISGDRAAVEEARGLLGQDLPGTIVKWGFSGGKARCLHPAETARRIRVDVEAALRGAGRQPYVLSAPYEVELTLKPAAQPAAELAAGSGVEVPATQQAIRKVVSDPGHILDI